MNIEAEARVLQRGVEEGIRRRFRKSEGVRT
jgi:hypothetical protein